MKLYSEIVEQCEKVKQSGGTTEKWNSTVEQCGKVWNNVANKGTVWRTAVLWKSGIVWWNDETVWNSVKQCGGKMWNSKTVWHSSGTMEQYGGNSVEQYGPVWCNSGRA